MDKMESGSNKLFQVQHFGKDGWEARWMKEGELLILKVQGNTW